MVIRKSVVLFHMRTLKEAIIKDKTVLLRVDFNVTVEDGKVTEDFRIRAVLPTIRYLLENGASRVVAMSHFGRPNGEKNREHSLAPVAEHLSGRGRRAFGDQNRIPL